jgi:hypothetical protein
MRIYKQRPDKRKISFFIFTGLVLLLLLSFFFFFYVYSAEVHKKLINSNYGSVPKNNTLFFNNNVFK